MPLITGMDPREAKMWGGTRITVYGSGFTGAGPLYLKDLNGKRFDVVDYTVDSDSQITLVSPATGQTGIHDLYVVVNAKVATNPLVDQMVWDGDRLSSTGTTGGTIVKAQNNANRLTMVDYADW
ncbi:hypothetical protein SAMN04244553_1007 [Nocardia amikacinitolerans]|uniref:IPT/TIG domain-containing protein n=1 Tax=Nocardia amikacinitolerans TaxID=756689 RepID=A0A285KXP1_9NOCA|nr:IPT/TIG domain-containing protein [Nocardia amikacinitolerans]MCP2276186.1 IPT/TIG domain-containing protein [Nocardia amikacinitolerans]MCP2294450.1 IPT/TIG domain-containing protein [Nocardia amikacinitolerans]SNY77438.1 hypothetical protein SAMN04244553_1007 [Nocardia amikacinitolerans]